MVKILSALQAGLPLSSVDFPANADILGLFKEVWFRDVSVVKVKSHVCLRSIADPSARWDALGNACAAESCKKALERDLGVVRDLVKEVAQIQDEQRVQLEAVFRYLLALNRATATRMTQPQNSDPTTAAEPLDQHQLEGAASALQWLQRSGYRRVLQRLIPLRFQRRRGEFYNAVRGDLVFPGRFGRGLKPLFGRTGLATHPLELLLWSSSAILYPLRRCFLLWWFTTPQQENNALTLTPLLLDFSQLRYAPGFRFLYVL